MDPDRRAELDKKLAQFRQSYAQSLPSEFEKLDIMLSKLASKEPARQVISDMHQVLHKLAGSGGSFGFHNLSEQARKIEQELLLWLESGQILLSRQDYVLLCPKIEALKKVLDAKKENKNRLKMSEQDRKGADIDSLNTVLSNTEKKYHPPRAKKVWLVEADKDLHQKLFRELGSYNFNVISFDSIKTLNKHVVKSTVDLIVIDLDMLEKNQNGYCLPDKISQQKCPFIVLGHQDDFSVRLNMAQLGASNYYITPFDMADLINSVNYIFEKQSAMPPRVLIMDDDLQLAGYYKLVLESVGITADFIVQPEDLIRQIDIFKPDLVLMDLNMPNMSGRDLAGVIRQYKRYVSLPIVFLSAETDLTKQIDALFYGADEFITKPVSNQELILAVHSKVDRARALAALITKDGLTGLFTHSNIKELATHELNKAKRTSASLTFVMVDIDHFKSVNDSYGHAMGDQVIASLATLLKQRLRKTDLIGRYGGEEFLVILSECDIEQAKKIMENIRILFSEISFEHDQQQFSCSISIGISGTSQFLNCDSDELINSADKALYRAKNSGRNKTVLFS